MDDNDDLKIILYIILFILFGIIIITCKPADRDTIMTVDGPVPALQIGKTLEHEHILVDFIGADSTGYFRWNRDSVVEKMLPFVNAAKEKGVSTIIECTPAYLGRDPLILQELSSRTGVNFITNTGYYGARKNIFIPESFYQADASQIAALWINEFKNGIETTGIKPGFIKIAVDPDDSLSPEHIKLIIAAAITHLKTGLVIDSHTGPDKPAFEQLKILKDMGVDPSAFIWVHAQRGTSEGNIEAAQMGAWISLDNVRNRPQLESHQPFSIDWYADRIVDLKNHNLLNRILISHDSGWYDPAIPGGGNINGYTDIFDFLIPALKEKGITDDEINQIMTLNPSDAFKIKIRKLQP